MIFHKKTLRLIYLSILFALSCIALYFRFEVYDLVGVNTFSIRDIDRAFNLIDGNYIPLAGPELVNGGRTPGPFFYFLLAIPLLLKYSYESVYCFNLILNIASIGILVYTVKKFVGNSASLIALAFLSINMSHVGAVMNPQHPSFLLIFSQRAMIQGTI